MVAAVAALAVVAAAPVASAQVSDLIPIFPPDQQQEPAQPTSAPSEPADEPAPQPTTAEPAPDQAPSTAEDAAEPSPEPAPAPAPTEPAAPAESSPAAQPAPEPPAAQQPPPVEGTTPLPEPAAPEPRPDAAAAEEAPPEEAAAQPPPEPQPAPEPAPRPAPAQEPAPEAVPLLSPVEAMADETEAPMALSLLAFLAALLLGLGLLAARAATRPGSTRPPKRSFAAGARRAQKLDPRTPEDALGLLDRGRVGKAVAVAAAGADGFVVDVKRKRRQACEETAGFLQALFARAWADDVLVEHPTCAGSKGTCRYRVRRSS